MKIFFKLDKYVYFIFLLSVAICLLLVAIPGYYSNDELVFLSPTASFLSPTGGMNTSAAIVNRCVQLAFNLDCMREARFFRPVGGFILTKVMRGNDYPFIPHLLMTLLHAINATLVYLVFRENSRKAALLIAILFAASPLALYTVAWVAAIYDVLVTMAGLAMVLSILGYMRSGSKYALVAASFFSVLGLLSKETALVLPAIALLAIGLSTQKRYSKRGVAAFIAVVIPWIIYLIFRFTPLMHAAASSPGGYKTDLGTNIVKNLAHYAEFPLAFNLAEMSNVNLLSNYPAVLSVLAFLSIFLFSWVTAGFSKGISTLAVWILPLLPVLIITKFETQYLYATAIGLSMALTSCLLSGKAAIRVFALLFTALLTMHSFTIEKSMYQTGICQTNLVNDLSFYADSPQNEKPHWPPKIQAAADSPWWVLARLVGKWEYWHQSDAPVISGNDAAADLIMTNQCHLRPAVNRN